MLIDCRISPSTSGSHKEVYFQCDYCWVEQKRVYRYLVKQRLRTKDLDVCRQCCDSLSSKNADHNANRSAGVRKALSDDPSIKLRISATLKRLRTNVGEKNAMKRPDVRKKMSQSRTAMLANPDVRRQIAMRTRQAWAEGKFDGVRVGQCEWYDYEKQNGTVEKCQGTWELAFAEWLEKFGIPFRAHVGRIPYTDSSGSVRSFYPDFYLPHQNCYIDVKNDYHLSQSKEKFRNIFRSNPQRHILILRKVDLVALNIF